MLCLVSHVVTPPPLPFIFTDRLVNPRFSFLSSIPPPHTHTRFSFYYRFAFEPRHVFSESRNTKYCVHLYPAVQPFPFSISNRPPVPYIRICLYPLLTQYYRRESRVEIGTPLLEFSEYASLENNIIRF